MILHKQIKRFDPCGKALRAILDGKDRSKDIVPETFNRLLGSLVWWKPWWTRIPIFQCANHCRKLLGRSRLWFVRIAQYCSKAWQVADWKEHKLVCTPVDKQSAQRSPMDSQAKIDQHRDITLTTMVGNSSNNTMSSFWPRWAMWEKRSRDKPHGNGDQLTLSPKQKVRFLHCKISLESRLPLFKTISKVEKFPVCPFPFRLRSSSKGRDYPDLFTYNTYDNSGFTC